MKTFICESADKRNIEMIPFDGDEDSANRVIDYIKRYGGLGLYISDKRELSLMDSGGNVLRVPEYGFLLRSLNGNNVFISMNQREFHRLYRPIEGYNPVDENWKYLEDYTASDIICKCGGEVMLQYKVGGGTDQEQCVCGRDYKTVHVKTIILINESKVIC